MEESTAAVMAETKKAKKPVIQADAAGFRKLRIFNGIAAVIHAVQGFLMLYLSNDFSLPVTTAYLEFNPELQKLLPVSETWFEVPLGPMVAAFLFMSAIAHFLIILPGINKWYVKNISKGINPARWIEYSFSSSLMIVIIAMLFGMYDFSSLVLLFSLNAMMILFGWMMELINQYTKKTNWLAYWFGCLAGIIPWIVIFLYFIGAGSEGAEPPTFVYWIFGTIFVAFNIFAFNIVLQYKKVGKWKNYIYGEYVYIILSLVAKSLLAWQVFAGTLRPV